MQKVLAGTSVCGSLLEYFVCPETEGSGLGILVPGDFVVNPQENSKSKPHRPFAIKRKQIASQTQQLCGPLAFVMREKKHWQIGMQ